MMSEKRRANTLSIGAHGTEPSGTRLRDTPRGRSLLQDQIDSYAKLAMARFSTYRASPTEQPESPRVFVVDETGSAQAIAAMIRSVGLVVEVFGSTEGFLSACGSNCRGCAVVDMDVAYAGGAVFPQALRDRGVEIPTILVSSRPEVSQVVQALRNGVFDFLQKPLSRQSLVDRVLEAIRFDEENHQRRIKQNEVLSRLVRLTGREKQVLDCLLAGQSMKDIAAELRISYKTVAVHHGRILTKTGTRTRAELFKTIWGVGLGA